MITLRAAPLTPEAFAPFGDVLEVIGDPDKIINEGRCGRFHDRAALNFDGGRAGISLFASTPITLPYDCSLVERHPLGAQAFIPMTADPFLVIVASDQGGKPHNLQAFVTSGRQGVNYFRNTWHGVLTPLATNQPFAVVDRIGEGDNLVEHRLEKSVRIISP